MPGPSEPILQAPESFMEPSILAELIQSSNQSQVNSRVSTLSFDVANMFEVGFARFQTMSI